MNPSDTDLLYAYLEGELTEQQVQSLETRLKTEPALAEQLLLLARDEATFTEWAQVHVVANEVRAEAHLPLPRILPVSVRRRVTRVLLVGAVAALVLLGVGVLFWKPAPTPEKNGVLAQLLEVQGEVLILSPSGESIAAQVGETLVAGQEIRTGGDSFAVLGYPDNTTIELSPLTRLRLDPDGGSEIKDVGKRLFLTEGVVNANVVRQPEGRPMVLTTPHAVIRVLGTRFSSAAQSEETRIDLEEGRVRMIRTSDGQSIEVGEGLYAIAEGKVEPAPPKVEPLTTRKLPPRITRPQQVLEGSLGPTMGVAISPNGKMLAVACSDGSVLLYDWDAREIRLTLKGHTRQVRALAFSPDSKLLATGSHDRLIKVWDTTFGQEMLSVPKQRLEVDALAFSPDGQTLAGSAGFIKGKEGAQLRLWDIRSGEIKGTLLNPSGPVHDLSFSPDGKLLAAGTRDGMITLWNLETLTEKAILQGHSNGVNCLTFSPDGKLLATAGKDSTILLWNVDEQMPMATLRGHGREVRDLAFSPDGLLLASGASDSTARLWDVRTGEEMLRLNAHKGAVTGVTFSPDGKTLVTCGWDRLVKIWSLTEPVAMLPSEH